MYDRLNVHNFNTYFNFDNGKHYINDKILVNLLVSLQNHWVMIYVRLFQF
jgi:hypothetical protein